MVRVPAVKNGKSRKVGIRSHIGLGNGLTIIGHFSHHYLTIVELQDLRVIGIMLERNSNVAVGHHVIWIGKALVRSWST